MTSKNNKKQTAIYLTKINSAKHFTGMLLYKSLLGVDNTFFLYFPLMFR